MAQTPSNPLTRDAIPVTDASLFWRAPIDELIKWVPSDPESPYPPRHADQDHQRWDLIAHAVEDVSQKLAKQNWRRYDQDLAMALLSDAFTHEGPTHFLLPYLTPHSVLITLDVTDLSDNELAIVRSWFNAGIAVCADPWSEHMTNGRHRLWSTHRHFRTDALVPIQGLREGVIDRQSGRFVHPSSALDSTPWFDQSDELNQRFVATIYATK